MQNICKLTPLLVVTMALGTTIARADALTKLEPKKLEAVHQAVQALRADWKALPRLGPFREHRANLHVHSRWSHDSRGTIDEIVAAAKVTGTSVLMFNEHPAEYYDFFKDGHQGMKDGVLLIPGAESQGFLAFPTMSLRGVTPGTPQDYSDLVRGRGGLMFVSHLEERMDWNVRGVTGVEIYNTHADFKDEKKMIAALRNPLWLLQATEMVRRYPQESYSALQDYPADYLKRWDELCASAPHTGVSANDAHQNIGLVVRWVAGDKARVEDALGKLLIELDVAAIPGSDGLRKGKQVGDELFRLLLDPYENSLRHVGTHLLLTELSEKAVRESLEAGRAFVAFDWLANSTGFDFAAVTESQRLEMGSQLVMTRGLSLRGQAPLPVHWRLLRNGKVVEESVGRTLSFPVVESGNYRAEAWLDIAGERTLWILSNPLYIAPPD
ncbi:MAG: PHP domain-containing protein [Planctomycetales bacterium]|nr:PHP domain-containing protein [Planctomycetales bacterium]